MTKHSPLYTFICAWACGCIRTHQHLRQISVIWWPELYHQNKLVPFLSLFCLFPMPNIYVAHGLFPVPLQILFCHSFSSFWPDLSLLTNGALKAYLSLFSFCLGGGLGGCYGVIATKKSDALFYFSPSRPLVLPFEILMLDGNPLWNCVMLGWVVRSQKWQLYLAITRFWILCYVYVYKKICKPSVWFGCYNLLQQIHFSHNWISVWH